MFEDSGIYQYYMNEAVEWVIMDIAEKVYQMVRDIPRGKVTTYGAIAKKLGIGPRQVGQILHVNPHPSSPFVSGRSSLEVPCHRVIRSDRTIAEGYAFGGEFKQREKLTEEGIVFVRGKILKAFVI